MWDFIVVAILVELTPGPNMGALAALTLQRGLRAGLFAVLGVALGLGLIGLAASLGFGALFEGNALIAALLRYAGMLFLLFLAFEAWQTPARRKEEGEGAWPSFLRALITNILNPKAALFYLAVMPDFVTADGAASASRLLAFAAVYVAIATVIHLAIIVFAAKLRGFLIEGRGELLVRRGAALALAATALWFFWKTRTT